MPRILVCMERFFVLYFETIGGSGIFPFVGQQQKSPRIGERRDSWGVYHILMLKRARSETGEFEHARHGGIEAGHVLAACRGEVRRATAAALDELCGCLHEVASV